MEESDDKGQSQIWRKRRKDGGTERRGGRGKGGEEEGEGFGKQREFEKIKTGDKIRHF